ncbi:SRPBCC family protein [Flavobacteriaceae bacterium]|jgi:ligand-binding SRPBCC domain-containing protein|nr:SRPBCC family protein [Flavobacteriaceae bacterium]MDC1010629.1 SRPBCC family protein [Flavobacteriaceae bacterium]MDC1033980.1 SRPBCC family protein [Flavobacteriaceae bacterium]
MKIFKLKYSQKLPISLNEAWDFLSSPNNLELITPKSMDFNITDWDRKKAYPGQIIRYTVKPILGIKINWVTEITHVRGKEYFVDEQRFGPYTFWHHKHFIKEIEGGVIMEDVIHYKPPFGLIGVLLNFLFINSKLNSIFKHRELELIKTFGNFK